MKSIIIAILASFLLQFASYAGDANDDTIEVVATGIGKDSDGALKNALRAAVEQAIGTMIDSETLAKNDEIVNEQILSYSGGFVKSHKVIVAPKLQDGLVSVKISARVKEKQIRERLTAAKLSALPVDGKNLYGEAMTKEQEKEAAALMLKRGLEGFPENVLEAKAIGKPRYDADKKKVLIQTELSINRRKYRSFVNKLKTILDQIAKDSYNVKVGFEFTKSSLHFEFDWEKTLKFKRWEEDFRIVLCPQLDDNKESGILTIYNVSHDNYRVMARSVGIPQVSIDILDEHDEILASDLLSQCFPWHYRANGSWKVTYFIPALQRRMRMYQHQNYDEDMSPGSDRVHYTSEISLPADDIKEIKNVVCRINSTRDTIEDTVHD